MYPIGHKQVDLHKQCREHMAHFMGKDSHASQNFSVDAKFYQVLIRVPPLVLLSIARMSLLALCEGARADLNV
jgi:hypothetical protein